MATFGGTAGRLKGKALPSPPSTVPHYDVDEEFDKEQPNLARTLNDAFNANYDANDDVLQPSNHIFLGTTVAKKTVRQTMLPLSPPVPYTERLIIALEYKESDSPQYLHLTLFNLLLRLFFGDHQSPKLSPIHQISRHSVSTFSRLSIEPHRSSYSNGSEPRELRTVLTSQGEAETVAPITKYPVPNDLTTPKRQQSQSIPAQLYQTPTSSSSHVPNAVPTTTATTKKKERSLFTDSESNGQDSEVEIVKISPAKAPKFVKTKYRRMTRQRKRASPSPSDVDSESDPEKHVSSTPSRRSRKKIDSENENGESNESVKFIGSFGAKKRRRPPPDSPPRQYPSRSRPKAPLASNDLTISTGSKRPTSLIVELTPLSPSKKAQYPRYFSQNDPELGRLMGRLVSVRQHYADKGEHLADHSGGLPDLIDGTYWHPAESSRGTAEKLPRRRGRPPKRPDADFDNSGSSRPLKRSRMSKPKNPPRTVTTTTTTAHARSSAKSRKQPNPTAQPTDNPMNEMFWVHHFGSETLSTVNLLSVHDQQRRPIVPTLRSLGDLSSGIAVTESEINGLDVHEWIWMSSPPKPCRMVLVTLDELTAEEDENVQSWMHVPTHEQEQVELVVGTEWQCQNVLLAAAEELEDIRLNDEVTRQNQEIDRQRQSLFTSTPASPPVLAEPLDLGEILHLEGEIDNPEQSLHVSELSNFQSPSAILSWPDPNNLPESFDYSNAMKSSCHDTSPAIMTINPVELTSSSASPAGDEIELVESINEQEQEEKRTRTRKTKGKRKDLDADDMSFHIEISQKDPEASPRPLHRAPRPSGRKVNMDKRVTMSSSSDETDFTEEKPKEMLKIKVGPLKRKSGIAPKSKTNENSSPNTTPVTTATGLVRARAQRYDWPIDDTIEERYCHQCRRKTKRLVMECTGSESQSSCSAVYCVACISTRYPDIDFEPTESPWLCPRCRRICNCTACSARRKEGYLGGDLANPQLLLEAYREGRLPESYHRLLPIERDPEWNEDAKTGLRDAMMEAQGGVLWTEVFGGEDGQRLGTVWVPDKETGPWRGKYAYFRSTESQDGPPDTRLEAPYQKPEGEEVEQQEQDSDQMDRGENFSELFGSIDAETDGITDLDPEGSTDLDVSSHRRSSSLSDLEYPTELFPISRQPSPTGSCHSVRMTSAHAPAHSTRPVRKSKTTSTTVSRSTVLSPSPRHKPRSRQFIGELPYSWGFQAADVRDMEDTDVLETRGGTGIWFIGKRQRQRHKMSRHHSTGQALNPEGDTLTSVEQVLGQALVLVGHKVVIDLS